MSLNMLDTSAMALSSASEGLVLQRLAGLYSGLGFLLRKVFDFSILLAKSKSSILRLQSFCVTELDSFWASSVFCLTDSEVDSLWEVEVQCLADKYVHCLDKRTNDSREVHNEIA